MTSRVEEALSSALRSALAETSVGDSIPSSPTLNEALVTLQYFIPEVLTEVYPTWTGMALDSVRAFATKKVGNEEFEMFGACELLSNFRWMLLHARLQIATETDAIVWVEFRVAEKMPGGIPKTYQKCEVPWRKRPHRTVPRRIGLDVQGDLRRKAIVVALLLRRRPLLQRTFQRIVINRLMARVP